MSLPPQKNEKKSLLVARSGQSLSSRGLGGKCFSEACCRHFSSFFFFHRFTLVNITFEVTESMSRWIFTYRRKKAFDVVGFREPADTWNVDVFEFGRSKSDKHNKRLQVNVDWWNKEWNALEKSTECVCGTGQTNTGLSPRCQLFLLPVKPKINIDFTLATRRYMRKCVIYFDGVLTTCGCAFMQVWYEAAIKHIFGSTRADCSSYCI